MQGHAESVKGMAREARDAVAASAASPPPAAVPPQVERDAPRLTTEQPQAAGRHEPAGPEPAVAGPEPAGPDPAVAGPEPGEPEPSGAGPTSELGSEPEPIRVESEPIEPEAVSTSAGPPTQAMEEPVRVDEPEPATVGRSESEEAPPEDGDRSLRELFWGED